MNAEYDYGGVPDRVFVAAARGHDAASASPLIGRTVPGATPDRCANAFVGAEGVRLFHDFCGCFGLPPDKAAEGIAVRTAYLDELLMRAYADVRGSSASPAGFDARPWRLPLDVRRGTTVYEGDRPLGVRFKEERVKRMTMMSSEEEEGRRRRRPPVQRLLRQE